ncbi:MULTISPECIES: hypothetical protein [unclassified Sphingobacterium]|uniref:hypothetical protein n=1 Tax=unclassified Sphingobacterium TaxID=2609468 RepID=UPI00104B9DBF|nr:MULTISPECIES: hypothetical protein [unclassified Sphingobacterium]MCS3554285.1 hypothetical protein [Sphingobacterium sp. JUb21]TCR08118.1 hypothetical protein EDF66_104223 [Sphingobacterium sp. JUb20]
MKKISLKNLGKTEILSREELKQILGGNGGSGTTGSGDVKCLTSCGGVVNGVPKNGTCDKKTITNTNGTLTWCECSIPSTAKCTDNGVLA